MCIHTGKSKCKPVVLRQCKSLLHHTIPHQHIKPQQYTRGYTTSSNSSPSLQLTHITSDGQPTMVDVSHKNITKRTATAQAIVYLPQSVIDASKQYNTTNNTSSQNELFSSKGSVFHTAIIAGTMAVKRTSDIIPFCHPLQIQNCKFNIQLSNTSILNNTRYSGGAAVLIECTVTVAGQTGVEMESIHGCIILF